MIQYISAFLLPGLMVMLFARVTYNRVIALVLTVALIAVSVYKGYTHTWGLIITDAFSLTAGFWAASFIKPKIPGKNA